MEVSKCKPQITASKKENAYYNLKYRETELPKKESERAICARLEGNPPSSWEL